MRLNPQDLLDVTIEYLEHISDIDEVSNNRPEIDYSHSSGILGNQLSKRCRLKHFEKKEYEVRKFEKYLNLRRYISQISRDEVIEYLSLAQEYLLYDFENCLDVNREMTLKSECRGSKNFARTLLTGFINTSQELLPKLEDTLKIIIPWENAGSFSWEMRRFLRFTNLRDYRIFNNVLVNFDNSGLVDEMCFIINKHVKESKRPLFMDCDNLYWLYNNDGLNYNFGEFKLIFQNEVNRIFSGFGVEESKTLIL